MAVDIETHVLIARPRADVAAFMFHPDNDLAWTLGIVGCRPITPGPLRKGSRVERVASFLGRKFAYEYEVLDADADTFVEMQVEKPFPMHIRYELSDAPGGTLARIRTRGEPGGFFKIAGPLMAPMVRRNITKDLEKLKECLEPSKA